MTTGLIQSIEVDGHRALFDGAVEGLIVSLYENEKPPCGLAGTLDWYFHGSISKFLQTGKIQGSLGEFVYFPISRHGSTFHLIFVGAGPSSSPGHRASLPEKSLSSLQKNLQGLKLTKVGISLSDFGLNPDEGPRYLAKHFKELPLWIVN
jgi:hypothetical protein